jgi:hypothetical protein
MRKRFGQSLRIGVAPDGLALATADGWRGKGAQIIAELAVGSTGPGHIEAIGAAVRQLLADVAGANWPATVVLADDLARLWQVVPPQGAARLADLEGAAALRFQALYGEPATGWKISAGWDAARPFMAGAIPRQLLGVLEQAAAKQRVQLLGIVPQFVAGFNRWQGALKPGAWYGQVHAGVLTVGAIENGRLNAVRAAALPEGASLEWLAAHIAREALRLNLAPPARLQLAGPAPAAWNNSAGAALACTLLDAGQGASLSPAARLALTGIAS